ncbi:MAG: hypothetical protein LBU11_01395 [Zoogloeaceae bacterium]|nr:hypothetical protein [Zoogloeaceae bacterium]
MVNTPTVADFRAAVNMPGNLRLSEGAEQAPIVRAGRFAWIRSALDIGGTRQANARTLEALKSALLHDPRYRNASEQIGSLIGKVGIDRPLSGKKVGVLLEKADAIAQEVQKVQEKAKQRIDKVRDALNKKDCCERRLWENIGERIRQDPGFSDLLERLEIDIGDVPVLNDADFEKLKCFVEKRMARTGFLNEKSDMGLADEATHREGTLDAALAELADRRVKALSVEGLTTRQQTMLFSRLMDKEGNFTDFAAQLEKVRDALNKKDYCERRLWENIGERVAQDPDLLDLPGIAIAVGLVPDLPEYPEIFLLNDADLWKLKCYVEARTDFQKEKSNMGLAEQATRREGALDAAIAELADRRIKALSVEGLTTRQQTLLFSRLMDDEGNFTNFTEQLEKVSTANDREAAAAQAAERR